MPRRKRGDGLYGGVITAGNVIDTLADAITEEIKQVLADGAERMVATAKSNCPVKAGTLRDSIHAEKQKGGLQYRIVSDAKATSDGEYYGKVVEFSPKINKAYLYPAIDEHKDALEAAIADAVARGAAKNALK